jgi:hypothetical protein
VTTLHNWAAGRHTDGTPVFMVPHDYSRKMLTAGHLERLWGMSFTPMPALSYADFLASRNERPCCWVTVISRSYSYTQLMAMGGIYLKRRTWATHNALARVPLSIDWLGAYLVWDLMDGLYSQHVSAIPDVRAVAWDPRGATNDTEPAVLVNWLGRVA